MLIRNTVNGEKTKNRFQGRIGTKRSKYNNKGYKKGLEGSSGGGGGWGLEGV
jgi:hypothetical protein